MLSHPIVMQELARSRNDDLLREAVRYRLAAEAAPRESRLRRALSSLGPVFAQRRKRESGTPAVVQPV
jgi:G:T-mismatch repair DNA endonuclease (very short patch repair protein)